MVIANTISFTIENFSTTNIEQIMFFNSLHTSIKLEQIEVIHWSLLITNDDKVDEVVCIDLIDHPDALYLYYNDPKDLEAIKELKKLIQYPYSLPI